MKKRKSFQRKQIFIAAAVVSIILYLIGVFSGLYASQVFIKKADANIDSLKEKTDQDIALIQENTKSEINVLEDYILYLDNNLKSIQMEQFFLDSLDGQDAIQHA